MNEKVTEPPRQVRIWNLDVYTYNIYNLNNIKVIMCIVITLKKNIYLIKIKQNICM